MAIVVTTEIPGGTAETFRRVTEATSSAAEQPAGALFRAAGPIPGGWRVVSGWESPEAWMTFLRGQLQPAWEKAGVRPSRIEVWAADEVRTHRGSHAPAGQAVRLDQAVRSLVCDAHLRSLLREAEEAARDGEGGYGPRRGTNPQQAKAAQSTHSTPASSSSPPRRTAARTRGPRPDARTPPGKPPPRAVRDGGGGMERPPAAAVPDAGWLGPCTPHPRRNRSEAGPAVRRARG
jgi:hypothetical protein